MTADEARAFLAAGRAGYDPVTGWQIAHEIDGELEWFTVNETDADLLDVANRIDRRRPK